MSEIKSSPSTQNRPNSPSAEGAAVRNPLPWPDRFVRRHIGPSPEKIQEMLKVCGFASLEALVKAATPPAIRLKKPLKLPALGRSEFGLLAELRKIASKNKVFRSFIGMGYYDCFLPPVIQRNILENPGWYTQYTPYQAEISQGRLEALLNFQTMIVDLTGMEIANASLLDEGTAAAEAMTLCYNLNGNEEARAIFVDESCHPQTIAVVQTRAKALGIKVVTGNHESFDFGAKVFAVLAQYPASNGAIYDYRPFAERARQHEARVIIAADLLSLTLLTPPGEFGADVVVGSAQRFGVPMGYGGPHAAFFATRDAFKRQMPGRLVGVSKDAAGRPALRLALQTREQHIRREKATSNICTAQVLLAVLASMYAVYHGPEGLKKIAERIHRMTAILATGLKRLGHKVLTENFFDTLCVHLGGQASRELAQMAEAHQVNVRVCDAHSVGISIDEITSVEDLDLLFKIFHGGREPNFTATELAAEVTANYGPPFARTTPCLTHRVFNSHHSETEMLRYIRRLESRDLSLTTSMIPLGSCTMKLNATAEMLPVTWPEFSRLHPFAPVDQAQGFQVLFQNLEEWLAEITGFSAVSLQPNAGSQGEYTGLLVIKQYHENRRQGHRQVCLIPTSAHGTNPASAVSAGFRVVPVACDEHGNISVADLQAQAEAHRAELGALMITYPSTHGVFEEAVQDICRIIHDNGGQVYMDGANMNAQVGLCRPGDIGADVCHLNLHKTFAIPHGGGGPGVGPICVASHLAPFLPKHPLAPVGGKQGIGPVASAPWGSAGILVIPWIYIRAMGAEGLTEATEVAILNANYIAKRLENYFPVLYKGPANLVAHECILDFRQFKSVTVEDVAKRLMDYGFHAPTISWPVPGTVMVEPTESEPKEELDRFCDALIAIHGEIQAIESGQADSRQNLLKNAPHTAEALTADKWDWPYSREQAGYPVRWLREYKFWPPVGRIDNVYGDRHPLCTCAGMEAYANDQ